MKLDSPRLRRRGRVAAALADATVSLALAAFCGLILGGNHSRSFDRGEAPALPFDLYVVLMLLAIGIGVWSIRESWRLGSGRKNRAGTAVAWALLATVVAVIAELYAFAS